MKRLPAVILFVLTALSLVTSVTGCRGAQRYDNRLVAADSLMRRFPDSALAVVEGCDGLTSEADLAYRALLLTQARYKSYIPATSDSAISRALAYYRAHSDDREKLTRAYIYKGAVMEELGHPDSAMLHYKHAEATAAPDDYFTLGYIKMRMGALYRDHYSMDGKHIKKYEEALSFLNRTDNKHYQLVCMINLGSLYCLKAPQKADSLLNLALQMAIQIQDRENYVTAIQNLMKNDINRQKYDHALSLIHQVMSMKTMPGTSVPFCLYAAHVYARKQMPDSATMFLALVEGIPLDNEVDKVSYLEAQREIAMARGDSAGYLVWKSKCDRLTDSLQSVSTPLAILSVEDKIDHQSHVAAKQSHRASNQRNILLTSIVVLLLASGSVVFIHRRNSNDKQLKEMKKLLQSSESELLEIKHSLENLKMLDVKDEKMKGFLNSYMNLMRNFMDECYRLPNSKHTKKIREIIKFQKDTQDEWENLYGFIDMEYDGIISKTRADHPQLDDKDVLLIALSAMDFSCMQIAIIMGYSNQTSVGTIRKRLCEKMNLSGNLNDYISLFK